MEQPLWLVANLQGQGARARQEDSFTFAGAVDTAYMKEKGLFFAVCDGMGGMKDGRLASETAVRSLRQSFMNMDRRRSLADQLKDSIYKASSEVELLIGGDGGCTAVAGILYQDSLVYASVGDSLLYLLRDGRLLKLNTEHNICHQNYLESIRDDDMDPVPCRESEDAAALTSFLGMSGLEEIDCSVLPLPLKKGDVLLACSDGVGGVLSPMEITDALQKSTPEEMCSDLERKIISISKSNQDNYTAIIVECVH